MTTELKEAIEVLKKNRERDTMLKRKYHPNAGEKYYNERSDTEEAIDTVVRYFESPPAESEEIPETLKGKAYDYMTQMKTLIKNQHTMTPDWVIAHAMSIVCYAYSAGVDFVVDTLKLEKKGEATE